MFESLSTSLVSTSKNLFAKRKKERKKERKNRFWDSTANSSVCLQLIHFSRLPWVALSHST